MTNTIRIEEVLWTLAAISGLLLWVRNWIEASRTLRAAEEHLLTNGRLTWARFARELTIVFGTIELGFVILGISVMFRMPNPTSSQGNRLLALAILLGASLAICWIAFRWLRVHTSLVTESDRRDEERDAGRDSTRDTARDIGRDAPRDLQRDANHESS